MVINLLKPQPRLNPVISPNIGPGPNKNLMKPVLLAGFHLIEENKKYIYILHFSYTNSW